jgi:putative endonuclease
MWYVYIIKSVQRNFIYTGSTDDIKRRIGEHNSGICDCTKPYKPFRLIAYFALEGKDKAINFEKYLKTGSGKAFLSKRLL